MRLNLGQTGLPLFERHKMSTPLTSPSSWTHKAKALLASWPHALVFMLILFVLILPSLSWAQAQGQLTADSLPTIGGIQAAADQEGDTSRVILQRLFGQFGKTPFVAGGEAKTLLGILFFTFNAVVFVVGTSYIGYRIISAIASSAHEGEVLGKRMNSLWEPIRMGVGVFGMVPVFQGFSLAQAVIMGSAILGIGMANMMVGAAIQAAVEFKTLIPPPGMVTGYSHGNDSNHREIADAIFMMHVCTKASNDYQAAFRKMPGANYFFGADIKKTEDGVRTYNGLTQCGNVLLIHDVREPNKFSWSLDGVRNALGLTGSRNPAISYDAINASAISIREARKRTAWQLHDQIESVAAQWYRAVKNGEAVPYPSEELKAITERAVEAEAAALKDAQSGIEAASRDGALSKIAQQNMKDGGWLGIGSWYATFAEQDAAAQSAYMASRLQIQPADFSSNKLPPEMQDAILKVMNGKAQQDIEQGSCTFGVRNAVGECSLGQDLAMKLLGSLNSGGTEMVNPVMTAKNIGDHMLGVVGAATTLAFADKIGMVPNFVSKGVKGLLASDAQGKNASDSSQASGSLGGRIVGTLMLSFLILGIMFAVYIPLIPFITWFTAVVSYFASVIEGLVGAQIWAFMHLAGDGEGMGQRTEKGYVYILNVLFRPALMVLGFFFSAGLMTLMATFFWSQFGTSIANLQGDTFTGPFIMLGLLFVYMIILLTMIQTLSNLIYEIPDRVIAWFGQAADAKLAKEMDGNTERKVDQAARWSGHAVFMR